MINKWQRHGIKPPSQTSYLFWILGLDLLWVVTGI